VEEEDEFPRPSLPEMAFDLILKEDIDLQKNRQEVAYSVYLKIQPDGGFARDFRPGSPIEPLTTCFPDERKKINRPSTADRHGRRPESRPASSQRAVLSPLVVPETPLPKARGVVRPMIN